MEKLQEPHNSKHNKMGTRRKASDAGASGLEAPVADLSARNEEASADGPAFIKDKILMINVPMTAPTIGCILCEKQNKRFEFLTLRMFSNHLSEQHKIVVRWICIKCGKAFDKLHATLCHIPKCKTINKGGKKYKCGACQESFDTETGRSQHERHRHPDVRNRKRKEDAEKHTGRPGRTPSVWTEEEVAQLKVLNERFKNERHINVRIQEFLPNKTNKQISDKRILLNKERNASTIGGEGTPGPQLETRTGGTPARTSQEIPELILSSDDEVEIDERPKNGWKTALINFIEKDSGDLGAFRDVEQKLKLLVRCEMPGQEIDEAVETFVAMLVDEKGQPGGHKRANNSNRGSSNKKANHNRLSKFQYARCQELYKKCPRKLVDMALDETCSFAQQTELPSANAIRDLYTRLWGTSGPECKLPKGDNNEIVMEEIMGPVTEMEIILKMRKIKANTAAGTDGIKKAHLKKPGAITILAKFLNLLLVKEHYPRVWKSNRTTLIPKSGKNCENVKNWRPITIGSLLGRILSGIIDKRIRRYVRFSARQKGFTSEDGCKANINLLRGTLSCMRASSGGVVTVVDISKAFDTVPHSALDKCLLRKGIPAQLASYIKGMYNGCKTIVRASSNNRVEIELKRGVKQGDPLSPLLFNLILDPVIENINNKTKGIQVAEDKLSILAFADDIVLISKDAAEAKAQLLILDDYLKSLGMELSIAKCSTFELVTKNKTWYLRDPNVRVRNESVPYGKPEDTIKYLGVELNPWIGFKKGTDITKITEAAKNVSKMKLKPHQKVELIKTFLLPRYTHELVASPPTLGMLAKTDDEIRQIVKKILQLHPSTTDGIIYTERNHGGIGLQRIETIVKLAVLRSGIKMRESDDPMVRSMTSELDETCKKYAKSLGLLWPTTLEQVDEARRKGRKSETERWKRLASQGHGVRDFKNDKIGNAWLRDPSLLKPSRYIDALKLRTNTIGTRVVMNRVSQMDDKCRRCGMQRETLGHILGLCIHTKSKRIHRHDEIKDLIADRVSRKHTVYVEPVVRMAEGLKKPDLVIKDQERLLVVEVTVRYENRASLAEAYREKQKKYKATAEHIRKQLGCQRAEVLPIVVGSRGAMPEKTKANLKALGLGNNDMMTISLIALRSSIEIVNAFIDYDKVL